MKLRQKIVLERINYKIKKSVLLTACFAILFVFFQVMISPASTNGPDTLVNVIPSSQIVDPEESFTVQITVDPGEPIAGAQADILFDPTLLTATGVTDGGMFDMWVSSQLEIDNINGEIRNILAFDLGSVTIPGLFAEISFTAKTTPGDSPVNLSNIIVGNPSGESIPVILANGSVEITGEIPDEDEYFADVDLLGFDSDGDGFDDAVEVLVDVDTTGGYVDVTVFGDLIDSNGFMDDDDSDMWTIFGTDAEYESLYLYGNGPEGLYDVSLEVYDNLWNLEDAIIESIYLYPPIGGDTTMAISPPSQTVSAGDTFTVDITIDPAILIAGAQADLYFNPTLLTVDSVDAGGIFDMWLDTALQIDNTAGFIKNMIAFDLEDVSTPGIFATITFTANGYNGLSHLTLGNAIISDPGASPVPLTLNDGSVIVTNGIEPDEFFYDVDLIGVDSDGDGLNDAVTVRTDVDTTGGYVDITVLGDLTDFNGFMDDDDSENWMIFGTDVEYEFLDLYGNGPEGLYDVSLELYDDLWNLEDTWTGSIYLYPPIHGTFVNITPPSQTVYGGDIVTVNITVSPGEPIKGVECSLSFDPSLLTLISLMEGDLFNGVAHTFNLNYTVDMLNGTISGIAGSTLPPWPGLNVTDPGTLATLVFQTEILEGISPLDLFNVIVCGADGQPVTPIVNDGDVILLLRDTTPPSIENVTAVPSCSHSGGYINLSAVILDDIGIDEVFLTVVYPDLFMETFPVTGNQSGDRFYCNKTYLQPGHYTYSFWANDTSGNSQSSLGYTFCITNLYPVADFTWDPLYPCPRDPVLLDGTPSADPDGSIITYNWSYIDTEFPSIHYYLGTTPTLLHHWNETGTYNVTLQVSDNHGAIDHVTYPIQVEYPTIGVSVSPPSQTVSNAEIFTVDIMIDPGEESCAKIAGMQFNLSFDPSLLTALSIIEGDFFSGVDSYFCDYTMNYSWCMIDNTIGLITGVAGVVNASGEFVSTPGTFATITFMADMSKGVSPLHLSNVIVGDILGVSLPVTLSHGNVTIDDTIPPEITSVEASPGYQISGDFVNLSGVVTDNMEVDEVFLRVLYPDMFMENFSITGNRSGDRFYCNRTYVQPGQYQFSLWANDTSGNANMSSEYSYCIYHPIYVNVTPSTQFVCDGETFSVDITVDPRGVSCVPIAGVQFTLKFDPDLLTALSVTQGDLFDGLDSYFSCTVINYSWCNIDNDIGSVTDVAGVITVPGGYVAAPGVFATVTFTANSLPGTSILQLSDICECTVIVGDIHGDPLPVIINDGLVKVGIATLKDISEPVYGDHVTSSTHFTLMGDSCYGPIDAIYYRIWDKETWTPWTGYWTPWMEYTAPFTLENECTHYLEYYSVDTLGNTEEINNQTHYVDDTPPISWKTIGEPHYNDVSFCQCKWVTSKTPITLQALDGGACAVDVWRIWYRIWYDGSWSTWQHGDWNEEVTVYLEEECKHYLEWYAEDILGNMESIHNQTHYVDNTPPESWETIGDPSSDDLLWVTTHTPITLSAVETGACAVGSWRIHWEIWMNDTLMSNGSGDWDQNIHLMFTEECNHTLIWWVEDPLGNTQYYNVTHYVDDTPPQTYKVIGEPEWGYLPISSGTSVTIFERTTCLCVETFLIEDLISGVANFTTSADENYTLRSDGHDLYITCYRPERDDIGGNIIAVRVNGVPGYPEGLWADVVIDYDLGSNGIPESVENALGNDMNTSTSLGNLYSNLTLGFGSSITPQTLITLLPTDDLNDCNSGVDHTYYRVWYNGTWTSWYEYTQPFSMSNIGLEGDCVHYLEWYSVDILGNTEEVHNQTHYVDGAAPVTTKIIGSPHYGDYVTTSTPITLEASDDGLCAVGLYKIFYKINGVLYEGDWNMPVTFTFTEECDHELEYWSVDILGNEEIHQFQTHYVDDTPPVTIKTIGLPQDGDYVTTSTNITLIAADGGLCSVGAYKIYYEINGVQYEGNWNESVTFTFEEECEHNLTYWSIDGLGNKEENQSQIHYVDDTPPVSWETVGDPHYTTQCCTYVTTDTPITLSAVDLGACAVGSWRIHWEIWLDETMIENGIGDWDTPVVLEFDEECQHCLKWYTEDDLGNTEVQYNTQIYYVDDTPPATVKEYGTPKFISGDAPVISPETPIYLNVTDGGLCSVDCYTVYYRLWNQSMGWSNWTMGDENTDVIIYVPDNCTHHIEYYSVDCLGNTEETHHQTFHVDTIPPVTVKEIGNPNYMDGYWITPETPIWLNTSDVGDHIVDVSYLYYEILWDSDHDGIIDTLLTEITVHDNDPGDMDPATGVISVNFTLEEECLHEIHWFACDVLNNQEPIQVQQHRVDTQSPEIAIGFEGPYHIDNLTGDQFITSDTSLNLTASDPGDPCASGIQQVLYKIEFDGLTHPLSLDDYYCTNKNITEHAGSYWYVYYNDTVTFGPIYFHENCTHILTVKIIDNVKHSSMPSFTYYVDNIPTITTLEIGTPHYNDFVTTSTPIWLNTTDVGDCAVGCAFLHWEVWWWNETSQEWEWKKSCCESDNMAEFTFDEECLHKIIWWSGDHLGNNESVHEIVYFVDDTPPDINKTVGQPQYTGQLPPGEYYVNSSTPIWVNATDTGMGDCIVGSVNLTVCVTYVTYMGDPICYYVEVDEGMASIGPLYLTEGEGMYYLNVTVRDNLGNIAYDNETFYVDNNPPDLDKQVDYPHYTGDLPPGDYFVSTSTPIWLTAFDSSGVQGVYYQFLFNGTVHPVDMTDFYCTNSNITSISGDLWYVYTNDTVFFGPIMFHEECTHYLTVMVMDYLGQFSTDTETFIVDDTAPATTKIIGDPSYDSDGDLVPDYLTTATPLWFTATDVSDIYGTYYRIWFDGLWHPIDLSDSYCGNFNITYLEGDYWYVYTNASVSFGPLMFHEECTHHIQFFSIDNLGHKENITNQTHYVDDTAPISFKHIGDPSYDAGEWVTTQTPITLSAIEIGDCTVDIWRIYWEIWVEDILSDSGVGDWNSYVTLYFTEECNHTIIWWTEDILGNVEESHEQHHYVDDTPPETVKTIGDPKYQSGYWVTTNTTLCLNATDGGACIVGIDFIHYEIWWDSDNDSVVDIKVTDLNVTSSSVCFAFPLEGYYELMWYAVDLLGNMEEPQYQQHYVDDTPPIINKDVGEPKYPINPPLEYYLTSHTPICVNVSDDLTGTTLYYSIYHNGTWMNSTTTELDFCFTLDEECTHTLVIWAEDDLGNTIYIDTEILHVDNTPPVSSKRFCCGPYYITEYDEWITSQTYVVIEGEDLGPCASGLAETWYQIWVWNETEWVLKQNDTKYCGPFRILEECKHKVVWWTIDNVGNMEEPQENIFHVDNTPPDSHKYFEGPFVLLDNGTTEYIMANMTSIHLTATDYPLGPCASGVSEIWYVIWIYNETLLDWTLEQGETLYWNSTGAGTGPFTIKEECKHMVEWWAIDKVGNKEDNNTNIFHVDGTPPESQKTVGDPKYGENDSYVTICTPIWLNITDPGICASGVNYTLVEIWWDSTGDTIVDTRLEWAFIMDGTIYNGTHITGDMDGLDDGHISVEIHFWEECYHEIWWYSVDLVGNNETPHIQPHYVDASGPLTAKEIGQPAYGDFVTTQTPIWLNTTDLGNCAVGCDYLHWEIYWWNETTLEWEWKRGCCESSNQAEIYFDEECTHKLVWWAVDHLGNNETLHEQIHYVDDTPPTTLKTIMGESSGNINELDTTISLNATDDGCLGGIGTQYLHYEIWWDSDNDSIVDYQKLNVTITDDDVHDLDTAFGAITIMYTFNQTGYHEVWWYSSDYLGNTELLQIQSHFIDDTPSVTSKEIGDPKYPEEGPSEGEYVTICTPIWLNATASDMPGEAGVNMTHVWIWWDSDNDGIVDTLLDNATIYDGGLYGNGSHISGDLDGIIDGNISVELHFWEECYHEIWWYSVDAVGNNESLHTQGHYVDATPPVTLMETGNPRYGDFVTTQTPIWLNTSDPGYCAVGCDYVHWEVYWWNATSSEWVLQNYGDDYDNIAKIYFDTECIHKLEWWSVDYLGNIEDEQEYIFYVDDTPPVIQKTVGLPQYTGGLPVGEYYISSGTPLWVNVTDTGMGSCIVGSVNLTIAISYLGNITYYYAETQNGTVSIGPLYLTDGDCTHYVNITVRDNLGNTAYDNETFYVDSTAPVTLKEIGQPYWDNGNWTTSLTPIWLNTTDLGDCAVGCDYLHWEIWRWDEGLSDWTILESGIEFDNLALLNFDEDCTHKIIWWSVDYLGNTEAIQEQIHYVDNIPPTTTKTILGPHYDTFVDIGTQLVLNATDDGCLGGIGVQYLHYEIWWDSDNDSVVDTQIDNMTLYDNDPEDTNPVIGEITFTYGFTEECYHEIWWYSVDYLQNQEPVHVQPHHVDDTPPNSYKQMCCGGFYLDDEDAEWINHDTYLFLEATDPGACASGVDEIWYQIWFWDGSTYILIQNETLYTEPFQIQEECKHMVVWWAIDMVGNKQDNQTNEFHVDGTPPDITKDIGHPHYEGDEPHEHYVTNTTPIWINATDNGTGICIVGSVNLTVTVDYLGAQTQYHTVEVLNGTASIGPLYLEGDCIHYVNITARDNIGNTGYMNLTFYVDITPPDTLKTIGIPQWEDGNWTSTATMLWLNATDPGVCAVGVCHTFIELWWDNNSDGIVDEILDSAIICDGGCYHDGTHIFGDTDETVNGEIHIEVQFNEECYHEIHWYSVDCFGNNETLHNQTHYVDNTPPVTTKEYGQPTYTLGDQVYLSPVTPLYLNATDGEGNCSVDCFTIYYRIWNQSQGWTDWLSGPMTTNLTLFITDSCMHYIEYYTQDCLANTEGIHNQTFYLDNTPPTTLKEIGQPNWNNSVNVTNTTLFWLNATDTGDCSTGIHTLHYEIWWDSDTDTVLDQVHTEDVAGDTISFNLSSFGITTGLCEIHWYSTDMVDNSETEYIQAHWVELSPP